MSLCRIPLRQVAQAIALCVFSTFAFAATQPIFPVLQYEPYAVSSPLAMAEGDLNGDGISDTLYAAASATTGSTMLTAALRSAATGTPPMLAAGSTVACTANSILLADLNKDAKLDAVVTCNENTVAVLAGNGDGTFGAATIYSVTGAAKALAADLNGDGFLDLAIATNTGTTASAFAVLINTGTSVAPSFAAPKVYGGTTGTAEIVVGDLNKDGKLDIIAGMYRDVSLTSSVPVFYNNGDGTFTSNLAQFPTLNVAFADFDGDNKPDVASYFYNSSDSQTDVEVNFSNASKTLTLTHAPSGVVSIVPLDVNGDGKMDIVLAGSPTTILLGDGTGNFKSGGAYALPGDYYTSRKGQAGVDLVFTTPLGYYTLHNDGSGKFDGIASFYISDSAAVADLNGDGLSDFAASELAPGTIVTAIGRGNGSFITLPDFVGYVSPFTSLPVLADFNGDGRPDLISIYSNGGIGVDQASGNQSRSFFLDGNQDATFTHAPFSTDLGIKFANGAIPGDFDDDGKQDLVIAFNDKASSSSGLILLTGKGDGTFASPAVNIASMTTTVQSMPFAADLNGDGKLDIVWGGNAYINRGSNNFTAIALPALGTPLAVTDLNGDNIADVVIDNSIYAGKGDGTFLATPIATINVPSGAALVSASAGDLNGDGNIDLVIQSFSGVAELTVAYGNGAGVFTTDTNLYTTSSSRPVNGAFARLNNQAPALPGDNRLDYIVFAAGAAIPLLNQSNPVPGPLAQLPTKLTLSALPTAYPLQPVSLQATLAAIKATGTMTYTLADGTILGRATVTPGFASTALKPSFPAPGTYTITATYSGDPLDAPSTSNTASVVVAKAVTKTQINSPLSYYANRTATISAIVDSYNPTASVTFTTGSTVLGTAPVVNGIASISYKFTAPGTYPIVATFPGDASNLPSTSPTASMVTTVGPDFALSATPTTNTVNAGDKANWVVTVTSLNNYSGYVTMGCQQDTCGTTQVYVTSTTPGQATFSVQTKSPSTTPQPNMRYLPIAASALLLLGVRRRHWKRHAPRLHLGLLAICLFLGFSSLSGCSSSKDSSTPTTTSNPGTTYNVVLTGNDNSIETTHTLTLTLVVK